MYQALYRKYRPSTFNDVVGQKIVVKTLSNAILNNRINHAYLFCGPRGTGKTSIAKIFAKTINCSDLTNLIPCDKCDSCMQINYNQSIDIIEIDAASNNGVDEIRELKNNVNLVPSSGKFKVYIIDEVHMLTTSAFNALLKTLEEPPKHVVFILATTEVHKIPQTVLSRCQRFDFKKINLNDIVDRLKYICNEEKIEIDENAIFKIADISNGGMRDALSLLDQIRAYSVDKIMEDDVDEINGNISHKQMYDIIFLIVQNKFIDLIDTFEKFDNCGKNLIVILDSIVDYLKNLLIYVNDSNYFDDKDLIDEFESLLSNIDDNNIYTIIDTILDTIKSIKYDNNKLLLVQLMFIKLNGVLNKNVQKNVEKVDRVVDNSITLESPVKSNNDRNVSNSFDNEYIINLKKIRIGNTLSQFNKRDTLSFKNNLVKVREYLSDSKFSSMASLILDGELKAKGNDYLLFMYNVNSLESLFNDSLDEIEDMFKSIFNTLYHVIAVNNQEWNDIKKRFNQSLKDKKQLYHFIDESTLKKEEVYDNQNNSVLKTPIDNLFEDIVQYN